MTRRRKSVSRIEKCEKEIFYNTPKFKKFAIQMTGLVIFFLCVLVVCIYFYTGKDLENDLFQVIAAITLTSIGLNDVARSPLRFEKIKGITVAILSIFLLIEPITALFD